MWGKAGVEFITTNGQKMSHEAVPMAILVTDGVREGNMGMVTTFCHHYQAKVEAPKHSLPYINVTHQSQVWL